MNVRGKGSVITSYGPDLNRPKAEIVTPFIHFSGCETDGGGLINYGNVGAATFTSDTSNQATLAPYANAPYILGSQVGAFENTSLFFADEATDAELLSLFDTNNGAVLFIGRIKLSDLGYQQGIFAVGGAGVGGVDSYTLAHNSTSTANDLIFRYKTAAGVLASETIMSGLPLGGIEHRIILLFDRVNGQILSSVNGVAGTAVTGIGAVSGDTSITAQGIAVTLGNTVFTTITSGVRATNSTSYLGDNWRDFSFFDVTATVDKVAANMTAIAAAVAASPEGYLPRNLQGLIE